MPDYPKIGMWPDGYYVTWNIFEGGTTSLVRRRARGIAWGC